MLKKLTFFFEGEINLPISVKTSTFSQGSSTGDQLVENQVKTKLEFGLVGMAGVSFQLTDMITLYSGLQIGRFSDERETAELGRDNINVTTSTTDLVRPSLGVGFYNANPLFLFIGVEYTRLVSGSESTETNTNSNSSPGTTTTSDLTTQAISVNLGARYAFK